MATKIISNIDFPITINPLDIGFDEFQDPYFSDRIRITIIKHPRSQRIYAFALSPTKKFKNENCKDKSPLVRSCHPINPEEIVIKPGMPSISIERKHSEKPFMYSLKIQHEEKHNNKIAYDYISSMIETHRKIKFLEELR